MKGKILVTGAGGYIGSVTTYLLLQEGYEVVGVDNFVTGFRGPLETLVAKFGENKLRFYDADISSTVKGVLDKEKDITAAIAFAASLSVNESMQKPEKYFSNNVCGSRNLFTNLVEHGISHIVFSSSCAVYGNTDRNPIDETTPTNPTNPYGASKRMVEMMLEWYSQIHHLDYVALRYFNVCGASDDGLIGDGKKPSVHLMQNAVRGAMGIEPFLLTYGKVETPDGSPIRDYVNVVDLAHAHIKALEYLDKGGKSEKINLGTGKGDSVYEIVKKVEERLGVEIKKTEGEARAGEYARAVADITKAQSLLGWKPERDLDQSIDSLVTWYKSRPHGWEK